MKRRVKKKVKGIIIILIFLLLATLIAVVGIKYFNKPTKENNNSDNKVEIPEVKEPVVKESHLSFIGVGDALIHDSIYKDAATSEKGSDGYTIYDFHPMFTYVADVIKDYDLKFYNQETVIGGKDLGLSNYPRFNSPDEIGENLIDIGFNIINLATNHSYDKGTKGALYSANKPSMYSFVC